MWENFYYNILIKPKFWFYISISLFFILYKDLWFVFFATIIFLLITIIELFYAKKSIWYILLYWPIFFLNSLNIEINRFILTIFLLLIIILLKILDSLIFRNEKSNEKQLSFSNKKKQLFFNIFFIILMYLWSYSIYNLGCYEPAGCWILFIFSRWTIFAWIFYLVLIRYIFSLHHRSKKDKTENKNYKINNLIKNIDIDNYEHITLKCNNWKKYIVKLSNLMKIIKYILDKTQKTEFKPNELKNTFNYAIDNYKSNISEENYKKVLKSLEKFVELWWKVEIKYKN